MLQQYSYLTLWPTVMMVTPLSCTPEPKVRALRAVHLVGGAIVQRMAGHVMCLCGSEMKVKACCVIWSGARIRM